MKKFEKPVFGFIEIRDDSEIDETVDALMNSLVELGAVPKDESEAESKSRGHRHWASYS